jgi:lysophospholipase L1-like esterase
VSFVASPFSHAGLQGTTMHRDQKITIVAMGDSTTAGTPGWKSCVELAPSGGGDETSQYAFWLMKAHPDWNVLNMGVNGERSDQIRGRFERDVIDQSPRVVIVIAGVNDVYQGRDVQHVKEQLAAMYERAKRSSIAVIAGSIVPYNTATKEQNEKMHAINAWIRERAAEDTNLSFVDTRAAAAEKNNPDILFESPDGLHPSPAGYRRMAEAIEPVLQRLVR